MAALEEKQICIYLELELADQPKMIIINAKLD